MKDVFHHGFQIVFYYSLCNTVAHRWNAQWSQPSLFLGNKYGAYSWWEIAARRHAIPDFVQVTVPFCIEHFYAFTVNSCSPLLRNHFQITLPYPPFAYR